MIAPLYIVDATSSILDAHHRDDRFRLLAAVADAHLLRGRMEQAADEARALLHAGARVHAVSASPSSATDRACRVEAETAPLSQRMVAA